MNKEEIKHRIINIIAKLDNGSHSANQLQGVDEALTELFNQELQSLVEEIEGLKKSQEKYTPCKGDKNCVKGCLGSAIGSTLDQVSSLIKSRISK